MIAARTETPQLFPAPPALPLPSADPPTGTHVYLFQNSRLGLPAQVPIWEPGFLIGNHQNALGLRAALRQTRVGSRCSGKERDGETGLDYFGARYLLAAQGRFTSPDSPSYGNRKNPQTWNLYAYSLNNPVTFRDPDGHKIDCANNTQQCQADAAAATGNAQAAARVTTKTTTTQHSFLGIFHWTTTETQIAIKGDVSSFRALSPNASKLADLVTSDKTITVTYTDVKPGTWSESGTVLRGGSTSRTPTQGWADPAAWIDPSRTQGAVYDPDAVAQNIPQANTAEEFGHEVLGHIWGELFGGAPAGTRGNMRDSIRSEDAVRALDPARGQKGLESHHNYQEANP